MKIEKRLFGGVDLMGKSNTFIFYSYGDKKIGNDVKHGLFNYFFVKGYYYHGVKKGLFLIYDFNKGKKVSTPL